ncbi:hypothetical protein BJF83_17190 [Nocardiopsis sp. CNR-923]|uniref:hypothetical protein n=1 Tax=Nocardiopsis sp. CNR-923 TaxID=1904965 RepID=UPI00095AC36E|nr:hypothetical protein [Nocardiopsis sp. CNR-923]OLT27826.1 hypothetical protein BJF83_17190 [Nocardiopsis sp. CNR-923]
MTTAVWIAAAAGLLVMARKVLDLRDTRQRRYPPRARDSTGAAADPRRALKRAEVLGASTGHLWAWRALLSDTAAEASRVSAGDGRPADEAERRRAFDDAQRRIRSALTGLDLPGSSAPARYGKTARGADPWSG